MSDERTTEIMRRQEWMESDRQPWVPNWEEIAELLDPRYVNTFRTMSNWNSRQGQDNTEKQFDITPSLALQRFSSAMDWMLTPVTQKYQRIRAVEPALNNIPRVQRYLDEVRDILFRYRYAPKANFASQIGEHWMGLGSFGTSCTFIDRLDGGGLRYKNIHLGEIAFLENHQGIIDTAHRKFQLSARQAAQKFGDKCPKTVLESANNPDSANKKYTFIHCVYPNSDKDTKDYGECSRRCARCRALKQGLRRGVHDRVAAHRDAGFQ